MPQSSPKLFDGYRALGFVSNHVPIQVRFVKSRKEHLVVSCAGKVFHTYSTSRLQLLSVSKSHPEEIRCLAANAQLVFSTSGNQIFAWKRGHELVHTYSKHDKPVHIMLPFGPHLISVDEGNTLRVWEVETQEDYTVIEFGRQSFIVTAVMHPSTYLNKILIGSRQGVLQLWNIRHSKLIYTFDGWGASVTTIEQAPAVDVAAIGLSNGAIYIHNLKMDETVMKFQQDWGPVTALSFRSDGSPIMASASPVGHVALWNLESRLLDSELKDIHSSSVTGLRFLDNEPLLITSSPDNSIKMWIFDLPEGGGRMLKRQSGHSAPPTRIRFHGSLGTTILSAAQDSTLRVFSTICDQLNRSFGQASYNRKIAKKKAKREDLKMPPILDFTSETTREQEWDSIACVHRGLSVTTTWTFDKKRMGEHKLVHERFQTEQKLKSAAALCVTLTFCGNFVLIGYDSGHVDRFNIQSGIYRMSYGTPRAHKRAVRGVACDTLNVQVMTGGSDKTIRFWKMKDGELLEELQLDTGVDKMELHRESNLLGVVLDDFGIILVDVDAHKISRRFVGHTNRVTDVSFSFDSRWLISASMDGSIKTWDVPSGQLINCFLVDEPCTSLCLSPTGEFLVTCHVDDLGVYLWSNRSLYTHVSMAPLPEDFEPATYTLPGAKENEVAEENMEVEMKEEEDNEFKSPEQISDELVTLSLLPNSRWLNLLQLDVIKMRNKPKEPPKKPKSAPFFLPTVPGLQVKFALPSQSEEQASARSRILTSVPVQPLTEFAKILESASSEDDYDAVLQHLKEEGPSAVDFDLRSLNPESGGSIPILLKFLKVMQHYLQQNRDFEAVNGYLALFLKQHQELLSTDEELHKELTSVRKAVTASWDRLEERLQQVQCLASFMHSAIL